MTKRDITRRKVLSGIVTVTGLGVGAGAAQGSDTARYNIGTAPGRSASSAVMAEASTVHGTFDFGSIGGAVVGEFSESTLERLEQRDDVRYVERDGTRHILEYESGETVEEAEDTIPWGVERINADELLDANPDNTVKVGVLDTGIDPNHESLEVEGGKAYADCVGSGCGEPWGDDRGHGTHVAGSVAAVANDVGVVGVFPEAELYSLKVLGNDGSGTDSDIADAIEWCIDEGIDVINMSLGGGRPSDVLRDAVNHAYSEGVLVVCAAGNSGPGGDTVDYPAKFEASIAVAATDPDDGIPRWSSRGPEVEIAAPGARVLSTEPGDQYGRKSGTSMASPHAAGAAAWLIAHGVPPVENPDDIQNPGGVRQLLRETAEDIGAGDHEVGHGLIDLLEASKYVDDVLIDTNDASTIRANSAVLGGSIRINDDDLSVEAYCEWREAGDDWSETERESITEDGEFTVELTDLSPGTTYEFRAVADTGEERFRGETVSFESALEHLAVATNEPSEIEWNAATLQGRLRGFGEQFETDVHFEWRPVGADEWETTPTETVDEIGTFEATIDDVEPESPYEYRAIASDGTEEVTGDVVEFETEEEPGYPEIDRFEISDESNRIFIRGEVSWSVTDEDGLVEVTSEMRYAGEDEILAARTTTDIDDLRASGRHTLMNRDRDGGAGEKYEFTLRATDIHGHETEETREIVLLEPSDPPTIEQLDVTPSERFGRPAAVVEWEVADEGGDLDGIHVQLRDTESGDVVDDASSPFVRGESASGSTRLVDRNRRMSGSEAEYEVEFTVMDTYGQETDEFKEVVLDERSPPPGVDEFDITTREIFGRQEVQVQWAVSDEGGALEDVELTLESADDGTVIDERSALFVRGSTQSGRTRLRDRRRNGEQEAYDVTIRVTDSFDQETEETERVDLS